MVGDEQRRSRLGRPADHADLEAQDPADDAMVEDRQPVPQAGAKRECNRLHRDEKNRPGEVEGQTADGAKPRAHGCRLGPFRRCDRPGTAAVRASRNGGNTSRSRGRS